MVPRNNADPSVFFRAMLSWAHIFMLTFTTRFFVVCFGTFALLQLLLLRLYLYWRYEWIDMPMHLFGGVIVGLGVFAARDLHVPLFSYLVRPAGVFFVVLCVALSWEAFEFAGGITELEPGYWRDAITDVVLGLIGGGFGLLLGSRFERL